MKEPDSYWPRVRRITIDEKLTDNYVRALSATLSKGSKTFIFGEGRWGRERETFWELNNYVRKLGVPKKIAPSWSMIAEGQVYIVGEVKLIEVDDKPAYFNVEEGAQEIIRVDQLEIYNDDLKWIYFELLKKGKETPQHGSDRAPSSTYGGQV